MSAVLKMPDDPKVSRRSLVLAGGLAALADSASAASTSAGSHSAVDAAARIEITDTLLRYFRALDRSDDPLLRSCFTPDATLNYPGYYVGSVEGFIAHVGRDLVKHYERTMHFAGNMLVEIDGDVAYSETYTIAYHMPHGGSSAGKPFLTMWIRYLDRLDRVSGWRINRRNVVVEWQRLDVAGMWDHWPSTGRRDRSDPSYQR
jgi:SnoaL-like domain